MFAEMFAEPVGACDRPTRVNPLAYNVSGRRDLNPRPLEPHTPHNNLPKR